MNQAKINITNISYDWFDYILKGAKKPTILEKKVNIQIMGTEKWSHFDSMSQTNNLKLKLYLNTNKGANSIFTKPTQDSFFNQTVDLKIRKEKERYYSTGKDSTTIRSAKIMGIKLLVTL